MRACVRAFFIAIRLNTNYYKTGQISRVDQIHIFTTIDFLPSSIEMKEREAYLRVWCVWHVYVPVCVWMQGDVQL